MNIYPSGNILLKIRSKTNKKIKLQTRLIFECQAMVTSYTTVKYGLDL